jgi:dTDP-glucose 4,6-dehydratase
LLESFAWANDKLGLGATAVVLSRNPEALRAKAPHLATRPAIRFHRGDVRSFEFPTGACSYIIHAGAPATPRDLASDPLGVAEKIVYGTRRALELAVAKSIKGFLFVSSGAVYGTQPPDLERIPEDYAGGPGISSPRSAYGEAKRFAEVLCALYCEKFGVPVHIARPFTFVGPYQDLNAGFAVTDFIREGLQGMPLHIQGDGTTVRSYCYAPDLTIALWTILLRGPAGCAYNVGSSKPISILELAHKVILALGDPVEIIVDRQPVSGQRPSRYIPDTNRAHSELGLRAWISLEAALERTIRWIRRVEWTV